MKIINQRGNIFIFVIVIISALFVWVGFSSLDRPELPGYSSQNNGDDWEIYENKDLGFRLQYPPNWNISESRENGIDTVNFYPGSTVDRVDVNDNQFHFSVYTNNIDDFSISGPSFETNFGENLNSTDTEYSLRNGDWWARSLEWVSGDHSGIIWMSRAVDSLDYICIDETDNEVDVDQCNEASGDELYRVGFVDDSKDSTLSKILSSFEILE